MNLTIKADPTFKAKVAIAVPGKGDVPVEFEFKHRTKSELDRFLTTNESADDIDFISKVVVGWELTDEFNRKNLGALLETYIQAGAAISRVYIDELTGAKYQQVR